jgi:hypothetical protein
VRTLRPAEPDGDDGIEEPRDGTNG